VTLEFQEFKEDEEYFGHALSVVWMRVLNLPIILREHFVLWALGSLLGVTQDVDMVTTKASSFGRFAVAVLEPEAIPTKLDVIIGNRYFQLLFEVEPYLPNIGLRSIWNTKSNGNDGHGKGHQRIVRWGMYRTKARLIALLQVIQSHQGLAKWEMKQIILKHRWTWILRRMIF
jgi:hypothetical protein